MSGRWPSQLSGNGRGSVVEWSVGYGESCLWDLICYTLSTIPNHFVSCADHDNGTGQHYTSAREPLWILCGRTSAEIIAD